MTLLPFVWRYVDFGKQLIKSVSKLCLNSFAWLPCGTVHHLRISYSCRWPRSSIIFCIFFFLLMRPSSPCVVCSVHHELPRCELWSGKSQIFHRLFKPSLKYPLAFVVPSRFVEIQALLRSQNLPLNLTYTYEKLGSVSLRGKKKKKVRRGGSFPFRLPIWERFSALCYYFGNLKPGLDAWLLQLSLA